MIFAVIKFVYNDIISVTYTYKTILTITMCVFLSVAMPCTQVRGLFGNDYSLTSTLDVTVYKPLCGQCMF